MNNPLKYVDPDGREVLIKISNRTGYGVNYNKIALTIKSQLEQAGVKDVNVYTGVLGKVIYAIKSLFGEKNMRTVELNSYDVNGNERGLSTGLDGDKSKVTVNYGALIKDKEQDINTAVSNVATHELGHNLANLKHPVDKNGEATDDGTIMGTKVPKATFGIKIRGFSDPDAERIRKQLNEENEEKK